MKDFGDIKISNDAYQHLISILENDPQNNKAIKIGIKPSGCSGYAYILKTIKEPEIEDKVLQDEKLTLSISSEDLKYMTGTIIESQVEGLNTLIRFNNPLAENECGCGESFTLKEKP